MEKNRSCFIILSLAIFLLFTACPQVPITEEPSPTLTPAPCLDLSWAEGNPNEALDPTYTWSDILMAFDEQYTIATNPGWAVSEDVRYRFRRWSVTSENPNLVQIANPYSSACGVSTIYCGEVQIKPLYDHLMPTIIKIDPPICKPSFSWEEWVIDENGIAICNSRSKSFSSEKGGSVDVLTLAYFKEGQKVKEFDHWEITAAPEGYNLYIGNAGYCYTNVKVTGCGSGSIRAVYRE